MCKPCQERWRIILAQQSKEETMKNKVTETQVANAMEVNSEEVLKTEAVIASKPDINKIVEERRKALLDGKTIRK